MSGAAVLVIVGLAGLVILGVTIELFERRTAREVRRYDDELSDARLMREVRRQR